MRSAVERLRQRAQFLRVAGARRSAAAPGLVLQARRRDRQDLPIRVGLTASKKVGNAVERNRARRRLRSAVEAVMPTHAKRGHDYVVIARAKTVGRPYAALLDDLAGALRRLKLWQGAEG